MAANRKPLKPVDVSVIIRKFETIIDTGKPITEYILKLAQKDPRVLVKGDVIYVKGPKTTIRFTIANSSGEKTNFYPTGITFLLQSSERVSRDDDCEISEDERLGLLNFPQRKFRYDRQRLSITDAYRDGTETVRYKFSLLIQRGLDGAIGVIDPIIVHDNSNPH